MREAISFRKKHNKSLSLVFPLPKGGIQREILIPQLKQHYDKTRADCFNEDSLHQDDLDTNMLAFGNLAIPRCERLEKDRMLSHGLILLLFAYKAPVYGKSLKNREVSE